jgi:hypothetical protein
LFGVAPETIDGLIQDLTTAAIDSKLRPIFAFVKKLTLTPTRMTRRCRRHFRGGLGRGCLAFCHRGLLLVQFHESTCGSARHQG